MKLAGASTRATIVARVLFSPLVALVTASESAGAQFPQIAPPPPCRVPSGVVAPSFARPAGDRRPLIVVEPLESSLTQVAHQHIPWSLTTRIRDRLRGDGRFLVPPEGSIQRAVLLAGGSVDSAGRLLGAQWIVRGESVSDRTTTTLHLSVLQAGGGKAAWERTFRAPTQALAVIEGAALSGIVAAVAGANARTVAPNASLRPEADLLFSQGDYLLRVRSLAAAESARQLLERAVELDTGSAVAAERLAAAYVAVVERGGVAPPVIPSQAVRRIRAMATFLQSRVERSAISHMLLGVAARMDDPPDLRVALAAHARSIVLAPRSADAAHEHAVTLALASDDARAESEFRRALALEPDRATTLAALAEGDLRAGRFAQGCANINASLAADPYEANSYGVRARIRLRLAQTREAYADAETAGRLTTDVWADALTVMVMTASGDLDGARPRGRALVSRHIRAGNTLNVRDATYVAMALLGLDERRWALESLRRARPVGPALGVALREGAFSPLRGGAAYDSIVTRSAWRPSSPSPSGRTGSR